MNKSELIDAIARRSGQTKMASELVLNAFIETITATVANEQSVQLLGFGTFKSSTRAARNGRNPKTGTSLQIPAQTRPSFVPGRQFKERVAGTSAKSKPVSAKASAK